MLTPSLRFHLIAVITLMLTACGQANLPAPDRLALNQARASAQTAEQAVDTKLFALWEEEFRAGGVGYIAALNENSFSALERRAPVPGATPFSEGEAAKAYQALESNLVTSERAKYEQPGTSIGYCFGRAMFVHLYALRRHHRKGQIRKIWAIGNMKTSSHNWAFHVATMVQDSASGEWRVIDSFMRKAVSPREWFKVFQGQNAADQDLRVYVTPAEKFTPDLGKYSRAQLGLDLPVSEDWYRHYFTDMMETLKIRDQLDPL